MMPGVGHLHFKMEIAQNYVYIVYYILYTIMTKICLMTIVNYVNS
jgi:hypothetical protein